jgi:hypothetical protein
MIIITQIMVMIVVIMVTMKLMVVLFPVKKWNM